MAPAAAPASRPRRPRTLLAKILVLIVKVVVVVEAKRLLSDWAFGGHRGGRSGAQSEDEEDEDEVGSEEAVREILLDYFRGTAQLSDLQQLEPAALVTALEQVQ